MNDGANPSPEPSEEAPLLDGVRQALDTGHPLDLLGMASLLIEATKPDPLAFLKPGQLHEQVELDRLIDSFIGVRVRETTALLAVFAELLDDDGLRRRCRDEAAARGDELPRWLTSLIDVEVYRAVRMTHVLRDSDEVLVGARLVSGDELTCVAFLDHDTMSAVKDAFFVPGPIDGVVSVAAQNNTDPDRTFVDMDLADARAWIQQGPENPLFWTESDSWPGCRSLLLWLIGRLPEGGTKYEPPEWDSVELSETFFASEYGAGFDRREYDDLLAALLDVARDPLRWSAARVGRALGESHYDVPVELALDAPDLLRAFIPFAHAQSGIRAELTAEALAAVDAITSADAGDDT
jgi:hypothetical protein